MTFQELINRKDEIIEHFQSLNTAINEKNEIIEELLEQITELQEQVTVLNQTIQYEIEAPKFYFATLSETIIEDNKFNLYGLTQFSENGFFNNERDNVKYRLVTSEYPNFIKYIFIPNEYINKITVQDAVTHSKFNIVHSWTDNLYTLLDVSEFNNGYGITANFEIKLSGSVYGNNPNIETL